MRSFAAGAFALGAITTDPVRVEEVVVDLWSRADRSGPLHAGNIVDAAARLNRMFEAVGSNTRATVNLIETNADGFDADTLDVLKAHSVSETPDSIVAAHEWIGSVVEAGLAANFEDHITANETVYADIILTLRTLVMYKGACYRIPQDSELRVFFANTDILRAAGKNEALNRPDRVGSTLVNSPCKTGATSAPRPSRAVPQNTAVCIGQTSAPRSRWPWLPSVSTSTTTTKSNSGSPDRARPRTKNGSAIASPTAHCPPT